MKPLQQDDVFNAMHVMDGVLSPDARFALYQVSETIRGKTKDEDRQSTSLWRVDIPGGTPRRLTAKGADASAPARSPDGTTLFFLSARDARKSNQIWRLPLDGGEAEAVTPATLSVTSFALSPDGRDIAFAALEKTTPDPKAHIRIDRLAYRFDPVPGYLQHAQQGLYLIGAEGGEPKALTAHDGTIGSLAWSPDGREVAMIVSARARHDSYAMQSEICVIGRDGRETVLATNTRAQAVFWTPDGSHVGFWGAVGGTRGRQGELWLIDRAGGEPASRTAKLDLAVGGPVQVNNPGGHVVPRVLVSPDGAFAIVPVTRGGQTSASRIALSGPEAAEPLVKGPRSVRPLALVGSTLLFASQDCNTPSELWLADLDKRTETTLTAHNRAWQAAFAWPDVERITVTVADGTEIEGWVLKPKHVKPPYKTILYIHGGPHAGFGYSYNEDFQELVGAGYAVAFANPRGSTGYGNAFSTAIIGRWGHPECEDFNTLLDELVRRGISDPDRLGVTGVSGGGHLSAWLIGHTDRFKAAVPEQGVYNMISFYGTSDAGIALASLEMGGHPHEQGATERFWELSPVAHAHKCTTPTLLIQGENDIRCPMEQAEQLFTILKHNGCKAEFLRLADCNHGREVNGPPPLRRFRMDAMKDWFDRHV